MTKKIFLNQLDELNSRVEMTEDKISELDKQINEIYLFSLTERKQAEKINRDSGIYRRKIYVSNILIIRIPERGEKEC